MKGLNENVLGKQETSFLSFLLNSVFLASLLVEVSSGCLLNDNSLRRKMMDGYLVRREGKRSLIG